MIVDCHVFSDYQKEEDVYPRAESVSDNQAGSHPIGLAPGLVWVGRREVFKFGLHLSPKTSIAKSRAKTI